MSAALTLAALAAFLLATGLTAACRPVARRVGAVAGSSGERWRNEPVPLLGGVAIHVAVVVTTLVVLPRSDGRIGLLLAGSSLIFALGLLDDFRPLAPRTKLGVEGAVAVAIAALGLQLRITPYPLLNFLVTVVWIVGLTNALNLLDNMDGLAAGIAIIAGGFRLALFLMDGNGSEAIAAAIFVGATAGFLMHNWNPASVFMGDAGSLFLGFYLAGLNLVGDWPYSRGTAAVLIVPVLILLVPIFETIWVTITRKLRRRPIAEGGRDHVSHHLVVAGRSEQRTVLLLYSIALGSGFLGLLSYQYGLSRTGVLVAFATIAMLIFGVRLARTSPHRDESPLPVRADPAQPAGAGDAGATVTETTANPSFRLSPGGDVASGS